jgi:tetratricopeptide (TPR) repeat protein
VANKKIVSLFSKHLILLPIIIFSPIAADLTFSLAQTGSAYITSKPSGAHLSLDNNSIDKKTDAFIENIPVGAHKITVEHRGYKKAERKLEIVEGLTAAIHFDLPPMEIKKVTKGDAKKEAKKEVEKEAKAEIEVERRDADTYHNRGFTHFAKNQYELAVADFTKAIELEPKLLAAYYNRGVAYFDMDQYDLAIADLTKAMDLGLKGKTSFYIRGVAHAKIGQYDLAIADLTKAIELDPKDAIGYNSRGIIYLLKGQYKQTVADFTKATELDLKNAAQYNLHLGFVLDKMGDKETARHSFFAAQKMDKDIMKKTAELLAKQTNRQTKRLYAEEILSASQYVTVESDIVTSAKNILAKTPQPLSPWPSLPLPETPVPKTPFPRIILYVCLALLGLFIVVALAIKFTSGRRRTSP